MDTINLTEKTDWAFIEEVKKESGENPALCYQCGNCTAGCPYTQYFDYPVSMVMRLLQNGQKETILNSKSVWLCATCETCTTRCPCNVDVAHIMDTLRIMARREGRVSEKDVKLFYDSFLSSMKKNGRMFELGIIMDYKLKSGHLMGDADLGPAMMSKGKIHFAPNKIKGADKVTKIFNRFQQKAEEKAKKHG